MATWRDGAAYAPIERPDGFATPIVEPLSAAEPPKQVTPGRVPKPDSLTPVTAPPLTSLGSKDTKRRDPQAPFETKSALLSDEPKLSDGHRDPRAPFVSVSGRSSSRAKPPTTQHQFPAQARAHWAPPHATAAIARHPAPVATSPVAQFPPPLPPHAPNPDYQHTFRQAYPPPVPPIAAQKTNRAFLGLATGVSAMGVFFPGASPLLLLVASGFIGASRTPEKVHITITLISGFILVLLSWLPEELDLSVLFSVISIFFAIYHATLWVRG